MTLSDQARRNAMLSRVIGADGANSTTSGRRCEMVEV